MPVKTIEHQAIASLHRLRSTWLATRTARLNTLRGLLREFGIFIPVGAAACRPTRPRAARGARHVPVLLRPTLARAPATRSTVLETNMRAVERQLAGVAPTDAGRGAAANRARRRPADGDRARRPRRRHPAVSLRPALCELSRPDAEGRFQRVAAAARARSASKATSICECC